VYASFVLICFVFAYVYGSCIAYSCYKVYFFWFLNMNSGALGKRINILLHLMTCLIKLVKSDFCDTVPV